MTFLSSSDKTSNNSLRVRVFAPGHHMLMRLALWAAATSVLLVLLMLHGAAVAHASVSECEQVKRDITAATSSAGLTGSVSETLKVFSPENITRTGLSKVRLVECALAGGAEVFVVVNAALAAGIPPRIIKEALDRRLHGYTEPAATPVPVADTSTFATASRLRFQFTVFGGMGSDDPVVGSSGGEDVTLSGGGGYGGSFTLGYGLSPHWDLDFTAGYQVSLLSPDLSDGTGGFERYITQLMVKYREYVNGRSWLKFGIGGGYYMPVIYRVKDGTSDAVIDYGAAPGAVVSLEYETAIGRDTSSATFTFGVRYYYVTYEADSAKLSGVPMSVDTLPGELKDLDGSGVDIMIGFSRYL